MKIAMVTIATENIMDYARYYVEINKAYCKKHGIDFICHDKVLDTSRHPVWSKIPALERLIDDYDWIIWIDADAAVVNHSKTFASLIAEVPEDKYIIMGKDNNGWNAGVFMLRGKDEVVKSWLGFVYRQTQFLNHKWREQSAMAHSFDTEYRGFVFEMDRQLFNSYHKSKGNPVYQEGDFVLHVINTSTQERIRWIRPFYQSIVESEKYVNKGEIADYTNKKLTEYLQPGANICLRYPHGLGDLLMFLPYYEQLKQQYPDTNIQLVVTPDKQKLIGDIPDIKYDYLLYVPVHFNEEGGKFEGMTKPETGVVYDFGTKYDPSLEYKDVLNLKRHLQKTRPFVGFGFFSTHFPYETDCDEMLARYMWEGVINKGLIPIELQFYQSGNHHNIFGRRFAFAQTNTRHCKPNMDTLLAIAGMCRGIAAVSTGLFHLGAVMMPENTLYIKNQFELSCYTNRTDIREVDIMRNKNQAKDAIDRWLASLI